MSDDPELDKAIKWLDAWVVELRRERTLIQREILDEIRAALLNTLAEAKTDDHLAAALFAHLRYVPAEDVIAALVEWVTAVQNDRRRLLGMVDGALFGRPQSTFEPIVSHRPHARIHATAGGPPYLHWCGDGWRADSPCWPEVVAAIPVVESRLDATTPGWRKIACAHASLLADVP